MENDGPRSLRIDPRVVDAMKAGKNELVFRPDSGEEEAALEMKSSMRIYEVIEELGKTDGAFSFSTCPIPDGMIHEFKKLNGSKRKKTMVVPSWNRAEMPQGRSRGGMVLDLSNMSRGMVFADGRELGRYDARYAPELPLPRSVVEQGTPIDVFDEEGVDPRSITLVSKAS